MCPYPPLTEDMGLAQFFPFLGFCKITVYYSFIAYSPLKVATYFSHTLLY